MDNLLDRIYALLSHSQTASESDAIPNSPLDAPTNIHSIYPTYTVADINPNSSSIDTNDINNNNSTSNTAQEDSDSNTTSTAMDKSNNYNNDFFPISSSISHPSDKSVASLLDVLYSKRERDAFSEMSKKLLEILTKEKLPPTLTKVLLSSKACLLSYPLSYILSSDSVSFIGYIVYNNSLGQPVE